MKSSWLKGPVSVFYASFASQWLKSVFNFAAINNQISILTVEVFSIRDLFMSNTLDLLTKQALNESINLLNKLHNAPVLYPTMHQFVTQMCKFL